MPKRQLIDIKTGEGLKEKEKEQVPISGERGQK